VQPLEAHENRDELRAVLSSVFSTIEPAAFSDLVEACELLDVSGGTCMLHVDQQVDALYGVVHGALRLLRRTADGLEQTVREFYRGEMLGLAGMFLERPVPFELVVVRDSRLVRLTRTRFLALSQRHPELLGAFARRMSEQAFSLVEAIVGPKRRSPGGSLALIPISRDPVLVEALQSLIEVTSRMRAATHLTARRVEEALGVGAASADGDPHVSEWMSELERGSQVMLYEGDLMKRAWTERCIRQADRLVLFAAPGSEEQVDAVAALISRARAGGVSRRIDLVVVHPQSQSLPSQARAWARLLADQTHHVRRGRTRDFERLARHLQGRPIGLVLGGGGARGIAHLGVIAALTDADVPIDCVCGVSMGAIFGAGVAQGWSVERMHDAVRRLFSSPLALYDFTVPISSLLAGKKLDRVLHGALGDGQIEDSWVPFFCVSTDLLRAALVMHDRGSLWKSVRASCSIPGIFPPVTMGGTSLVDGGLLNNLPVDLLAERYTGPIIAVDVFPYGEPTFTRPAGVIERQLRKLRTRLKGDAASPPLFDILTRSTLVGSKYRQRQVDPERVSLLEPPLETFGILQWRAHRAIFEAGYQYAWDHLATRVSPRLDPRLG
jgi:NTE family protein/lysophospholipid hydrolase